MASYKIVYLAENGDLRHYIKHEKIYRIFENVVKHATELFILIDSDVYIADEEDQFAVTFNKF